MYYLVYEQTCRFFVSATQSATSATFKLQLIHLII